jgi:hypothetical protein
MAHPTVINTLTVKPIHSIRVCVCVSVSVQANTHTHTSIIPVRIHTLTCRPLNEGTKHTPSELATLLAMASVSRTSENSSGTTQLMSLPLTSPNYGINMNLYARCVFMPFFYQISIYESIYELRMVDVFPLTFENILITELLDCCQTGIMPVVRLTQLLCPLNGCASVCCIALC